MVGFLWQCRRVGRSVRAACRLGVWRFWFPLLCRGFPDGGCRKQEWETLCEFGRRKQDEQNVKNRTVRDKRGSIRKEKVPFSVQPTIPKFRKSHPFPPRPRCQSWTILSSRPRWSCPRGFGVEGTAGSTCPLPGRLRQILP